MVEPKRVRSAVRSFWQTRASQGKRQGSQTGVKDTGNRTRTTGGKHLDGFVSLFEKLLVEAGIPASAIFRDGRADTTLPGFFRPTKQWDLLVVVDGCLLAVLEFKSLCGPSFGNNYNNRVEEAIGNASDIWTAFREGAFIESPRPFVGYLMLLEEAESSTRSVGVCERHFATFEAYHDASYAVRCEESLRRLVRERCYDAACLILSGRESGRRGEYREPATDLSINRLASLLCNQAVATYNSIQSR